MRNAGQEPQLYFWRDKTGNEVDLIEYNAGAQLACEIKSGATFSSSEYFKGLRYRANHAGAKPDRCTVIYTGKQNLQTMFGNELVSTFKT